MTWMAVDLARLLADYVDGLDREIRQGKLNTLRTMPMAQWLIAHGVQFGAALPAEHAPPIDTPEHAHWERGYLAGWRDAEAEYGPFVPTPVEPDSAAARRFHEIMGRVREEIRAGRTPEQELRDALTAVRPLIEREDVEDEEWCAAFGKEIPTLVDAAYRFLDGLRAPQGGPNAK